MAAHYLKRTTAAEYGNTENYQNTKKN